MNPFENENGQEQENDEIAKIYAMADLKTEHWNKTLQEVDYFYGDFSKYSSPNEAIRSIKGLIKTSELTLTTVHSLLENMIKVFEKIEEYEKCAFLLKIKKGL